MIKIYLTIVQGEKHSRIAMANRSINDMDGEEMDDECIFIDYFNGQKIKNDFPDAALNHTRNTLTKVGIVVITE
jgi:hypothetical protein